jgi:hypothetical protein
MQAGLRASAACMALVAAALTAPPLAHAAMRAVPAKHTDSMAVRKQGRVLEINSPSGVGSGELLRNGPAWPSTLTVRVTGPKQLEHFRMSAGGLSLVCALERPGGVTSLRVCRLGNTTVDPPLETGAGFEVKVPAELLATQEDSMIVEWVDAW